MTTRAANKSVRNTHEHWVIVHAIEQRINIEKRTRTTKRDIKRAGYDRQKLRYLQSVVNGRIERVRLADRLACVSGHAGCQLDKPWGGVRWANGNITLGNAVFGTRNERDAQNLVNRLATEIDFLRDADAKELWSEQAQDLGCRILPGPSDE